MGPEGYGSVSHYLEEEDRWDWVEGLDKMLA
jgi:hypothetical protein